MILRDMREGDPGEKAGILRARVSVEFVGRTRRGTVESLVGRTAGGEGIYVVRLDAGPALPFNRDQIVVEAGSWGWDPDD